jgi:hypothetical protein
MPSAKKFVQNLAIHLGEIPLPSDLKSEHDLKHRCLDIAVRSFTEEALRVPAKDMDKVVFTPGDTKEEKARWAASKSLQNIVVFGCPNTGDIFITHPKIGAVFIEVKFSKSRSAKSDSLPGDLQRAIGQSVIGSLRHPHVICLIVCQGQRRARTADLAADLKRALWEKHRIALVVRGLR